MQIDWKFRRSLSQDPAEITFFYVSIEFSPSPLIINRLSLIRSDPQSKHHKFLLAIQSSRSDIVNFFLPRKCHDTFPNVVSLLFKLLSNLYHIICLFPNRIFHVVQASFSADLMGNGVWKERNEKLKLSFSSTLD